MANTTLKKKIAELAFSRFRMGSTIPGAVEYDIIKPDKPTDTQMTLQVREQQGHPCRYFTVKVSEIM
jgi:hypothetical protein